MTTVQGYRRHRSSGLQWIPEIPKHWRVVPSWAITRQVRRSPTTDDGIVTAFRDGQVTLRAKRRTEGFTEAIQEHGYQGVRRGELVIHSMDGFAGAIGVSDSDGKMSPVAHIYSVRDGEPRYFALLLRVMALGGFVESLAKGIRERSTAFDRVTFKSLSLPLPPLAEQRSILAYLDRETAQIDEFIAKNEELIALLAERRAAAIEIAVAPPTTPSAWDVCQVRRLGVRNDSGVSVNGYSIPAEGNEVGVLKTGAVSKGFFDPTENKRVVEEDLVRVATPVRAGTLIVNRANTPELVGSAGYVAQDYPALFLSDKLWQLTFASADPAFIHYWTMSNAYRSQLRGLSVGASASMQNLSYADFLSVSIAVPPLQDQSRIVEELRRTTGRIDAAVKVAQRGIELARERRAALISAAATGKIDVRRAS